jgi:type IX secretion system PorP/SprF family membrane protein
MNFKKYFLLIFALIIEFSSAQEGISVYSDYLSDNYYLLHPSMAGAGSCDKLRLTARAQWFGQDEAPALQTLSYNARAGEQSGLGGIVYNDKNGFHSQKGVKLTYAHHLMFSRDAVDLNQLSFGLSVGLVQSILDQTKFLGPNDFDPIVDGSIQQDSYFNIDFGMSYNYLDFYVHGTVKNATESRRQLYTEIENDNIRKYIVNAGYVFGNEQGLMWEPSFMFQSVDATNEKTIDANLKVYKTMDFGKLWAVASYRRSLDGAEFLLNNKKQSQKLQYITPIVGINYKQYMLSYTYSYLAGKVNYDNAGFHQITLGMNLNCRKAKWHCLCPAVN